MECAFGGLGQIGLPKVSVQLVNKLTPIVANGWFWECDQDRSPPQHGDIRKVQSCVGHSLAVSHKLTRPTIKCHDTANCERVQLQWVPISELVGISSFRVLFTVTMWTCIVLLVRWPQARWVSNQVWLCRGRIVIGHWASATRGLTEVLGWYCWWCNWWCPEGQPWGATGTGGTGNGAEGAGWVCGMGGGWPQLRCLPDWYVLQSLLGCGQKGV